MPTDQPLAALAGEAVSEAGPGGGEPRVGQGLWEHEREMREAHKDLAGAGLRQPAGPVRAHGPAVLQDFHHTRGDEPG
ncbi:hypothetical protein ACWGKW_23120 [Streptomyces sp. NPDC054766]